MAALEAQVKDVQDYVHHAADRQALGQYLLGMFAGVSFLGGVAGLSGLAAALGTSIYATDIASGLSLKVMIGSLVAGALGAMLSVMLRMTSGKLSVASDEGRFVTIALGAFRAVIGGLSAAVVYLFLRTGIISLVTNLSGQGDGFYWAIGVLAGFSERWVPEILSTTERAFVARNARRPASVRAEEKRDGEQR
jgi:hypothetical protein